MSKSSHVLVVELVVSTLNCFSIEGIYENTTSRLLAPSCREREAASATTGMLSESGDCRLGDSYAYGTLLPTLIRDFKMCNHLLNVKRATRNV